MAEGLYITARQAAPIPLDFELELPAGRTMALVGPSGGGKSTVLRAIAGLYRPREGLVRCNGEVWFDTSRGIDLAAKDRRAGLVFQSYALFPHLSAEQNVMEAMLDLPPDQRRAGAHDLMARLGMAGLEERKPGQLSGGQQQRVALARRPAILLLDEPFSAVDHPTRRLLHGALAQVRETSDIPILLVTHDIEDAARVADDLCFVQAGRNVETGAVRALLDDPGSMLARWMAGEDPGTR
jgi:molybdate transport system ATP-binding protein